MTTRKYTRRRPHNRSWAPILAEAKRVVDDLVVTYGLIVTLRQLHYLLIGFGGYENNKDDYGQLSERTAELRRDGLFPSLSDTTRKVSRPLAFSSPAAAARWLAQVYVRDRTENQKFQQWVLFEKSTLSAQIDSWTEDRGIPNAALRGYSSESLEREIFDAMIEDGRPVVAFYIGDFDPEGWDIERNFRAQAVRQGITFHHWQRLALTKRQIGGLSASLQPGKPNSSRAKAFIAQFGSLFQIEIEALPPNRLEKLVTSAIDKWNDDAILQASIVQEQADIKVIKSW